MIKIETHSTMSMKITVLLLCLIAITSTRGDVLRRQERSSTKAVSQKCSQQKESLDFMTTLKMWDAGSKFIPSGIARGNIYDLGSFDECYNIEVNQKSEPMYGKYCLGVIGPNSLGIPLFSAPALDNITKLYKGLDQSRSLDILGLHFATCVPSGCTAEDISWLVAYTEEYCYSKDTTPNLNEEAIAGIAIISLFGLITLVSTAFHTTIYYTNKISEPPHELLTSFSIITNGKVLTSPTNRNQLLCLNGLKAISMMWVIVFHCFAQIPANPLRNIMELVDWLLDSQNMWVISGTLSVDTFFLAGGVVIVYTFLKANERGVKFNILSYYLHRYLRLTPAIAIVVLIYATIFKHLGTGPLWSNNNEIIDSCKQYWWTALLHIQNYINWDHRCVGQTWYVSVDMQLYILSPIILIPLTKWPKHTIRCLYALAVLGIVVPFIMGYIKKLNAFALGNGEFDHWYYVQAYTRFGPYVIGMILGYFIYTTKVSTRRLNIHWMLSVAMWLVSLSVLLACVFAGNKLITEEYDRWSHSLFLAFTRPAWAVAVSGVIFLCVSGNGGPINDFLSASVFQFISKLSYSMYLIHKLVINVWYNSKKETFQFSTVQTMMDFIGIFMVSLALAILLYLFIESPLTNLDRILFADKKKKKESIKQQA